MALRDRHSAGSPKSRKSGFWDFEKCRKYCEKYFFEKKTFFSWEAFGSRYFVCRIVFGSGGAGNARTLPIFEKSKEIHDLGHHLAASTTGSCPPIKPSKNILQKMCTSCRACRWVGHSETFATCWGNVFMISVHSIFSIFRSPKLFFLDFLKMLSGFIKKYQIASSG